MSLSNPPPWPPSAPLLPAPLGTSGCPCKSNPRISCLSKGSPGSFYWRTTFRNEGVGAGCACRPGASLSLGLIVDRARSYTLCVYTNPHVHTDLQLVLHHMVILAIALRDVLCTQLTGAMRFKSLFKSGFKQMSSFFLSVTLCSLWDLSSLTRDQTCTAPMGSAELQPLDSQGSSSNCLCSFVNCKALKCTGQAPGKTSASQEAGYRAWD